MLLFFNMMIAMLIAGICLGRAIRTFQEMKQISAKMRSESITVEQSDRLLRHFKQVHQCHKVYISIAITCYILVIAMALIAKS